MEIDRCTHIENINVHEPHTKGCEECLKVGDQWVNLRLCLDCGKVGCCDNSPNKHASQHAKESGHPVIQTFEPEPTWLYCYDDDVMDDKPKVYFDGNHTTFAGDRG